MPQKLITAISYYWIISEYVLSQSSVCVAEEKPSSMELQYQDSPWQRVNEETTLHFNPVDGGTWISVSEDHARKLENSNFILSFAHTDYQPDSVRANQPILHWTTTTTKQLKPGGTTCRQLKIKLYLIKEKRQFTYRPVILDPVIQMWAIWSEKCVKTPALNDCTSTWNDSSFKFSSIQKYIHSKFRLSFTSTPTRCQLWRAVFH